MIINTCTLYMQSTRLSRRQNETHCQTGLKSYQSNTLWLVHWTPDQLVWPGFKSWLRVINHVMFLDKTLGSHSALTPPRYMNDAGRGGGGGGGGGGGTLQWTSTSSRQE